MDICTIEFVEIGEPNPPPAENPLHDPFVQSKIFSLICAIYISIAIVTLYGLMSPQNKDLEKEIIVWGL